MEINPGEIPGTVSRETLISRYFPDDQRIRAYAEFLKNQGIERGLIGPREADRIWERHIFNCLPITTLFSKAATVFDIGSGAGLPGIVIALARPDLKVVLIEPLERRVEFLQEAVAALSEIEAGTPLQIQVIRGRSQEEMLTVPKSTLHEVNLEGIELGRIVEIKKGA